MSRTLRLITVGLLLAVVVAGVAFVALRGSSGQRTTFTAQFEDAVGLYTGNAVSVLGMRIGSVSDIVDKGNYVEVTMEVDGDVDIPADVQAVTVNTSILTDRHVELTPAYRGGPKLTTGDVIGLARTRTPVEFDRTLAMIDKLSVALRGDGAGSGPLADFIAASEAVVAGKGPDVKQTLDRLSQALRLGADHGAHTTEDIESIVDNLGELTQVAAQNDAAIREFGSNLRQVSDIIADEDLGGGSTGAQINEILATSAALLENNRDKLRGSASDLLTVTQAIVDYRREIAETFDVAPLTLDNSWNSIDMEAGALRSKFLLDKMMLDSQVMKELCNIAGAKQLGCATGTVLDFGPDFGLQMMLDLMGGENP